MLTLCTHTSFPALPRVTSISGYVRSGARTQRGRFTGEYDTRQYIGGEFVIVSFRCCSGDPGQKKAADIISFISRHSLSSDVGATRYHESALSTKSPPSPL